MGVCNKCKKKTDRLYNGICAECLNEQARKEMCDEEEIENNTEGLFPVWNLEEIFEIAEMNGMRDHMKYDAKSVEYHITQMTRLMELSEKELKIYHGPMKNLIKKNIDGFNKCNFKLCKKTDFGVTCGGNVLDELGGLIMYV